MKTPCHYYEHLIKRTNIMIKTTLALLSFSSIIQAQQPSKDIEQGFKKLAPTAKISTATATPIKGIQQINLESDNINDVYYMTEDGKYFINGSITEVETRQNLTENTKTAKRKEIVSQFGKDQRIDFFPKNMKHHVTVYTDIDCGYCRKLHAEMKDFNDLGIGISYLFWPRSGLNSPSFNKAVTAWCAVDKNEAMTQSQNGITLPPKQCDNPVAEHFNSGLKLGVRGTPNIVTDEGILYPTYMSASDLLKRLEMVASK